MRPRRPQLKKRACGEGMLASAQPFAFYVPNAQQYDVFFFTRIRPPIAERFRCVTPIRRSPLRPMLVYDNLATYYPAVRSAYALPPFFFGGKYFARLVGVSDSDAGMSVPLLYAYRAWNRCLLAGVTACQPLVTSHYAWEA